jgi:hypothetical protein
MAEREILVSISNSKNTLSYGTVASDFDQLIEIGKFNL